MNLFNELKRRNVFRVIAVYLALTWPLIQVAGAIENAIALPGWFDAMVIALLAIGFPLVVLFSWAFEVTPEGLKPTSQIAPETSIAGVTGRKLDMLLLAALALVVVVVVGDRMMPATVATTTASDVAQTTIADAAATPGPALDDKSIAVLPFVDLSPERNQEYFADGLSEELLNVLAQSKDLRVAGRTSSFAYKGRSVDMREIGDALGVAHILEGSVRKSGARIRVTAQLIKASDGYHVFSDTYDRDLADIFAVQDDIAGKIGAALKAQLSGESATQTAPSALEAYDLYLIARQGIATRDPGQLREARERLDQALALDPSYAPALAQKAILVLLLSNAPGAYGEMPVAEAVEEAQKLIDRALAAAPDFAEAHAALGVARLYGGGSLADAETALKRAIALNPSLSDAQNWLANVIARRGDHAQSLALYEALFERDPLYRPAFSNLVSNYTNNQNYEQAEKVIARVERIVGEDTSYTLLSRGVVALEKNELAEAARRLGRALELGLTSNVLHNNYAFALTQLGEIDAALDVSPPFLVPVLLHLAGRRAEAGAAARELAAATPLPAIFLEAIFYDFAITGRHAEAAGLVENRFGSPMAISEAYPAATVFWGGALSVNYRALGRNDKVAETVRLMEDAATLEREGGGDGYVYWHTMAEIAALKGEPDLALVRLQTLVERGYADVFGFHAPAFDSLRDDDRFKALEKQIRDNANAERVKLGLKPL